MDESVPWSAVHSSALRPIAVDAVGVPISNSLFIVFRDLMLISIFSLTFGIVRGPDGGNIESTWYSPPNMRNTSCRGCER